MARPLVGTILEVEAVVGSSTCFGEVGEEVEARVEVPCPRPRLLDIRLRAELAQVAR